MDKSRWIGMALVLGIAGCGAPDNSDQTSVSAPPASDTNVSAMSPGAASSSVVARLQKADGAAAGTATATSGEGGVRLSLSVEGLPEGSHGAHVHMVGRCDAPTFETAGSHWNPTSAKHGLENPDGQHAGDMPNLTVDSGGRGTLDYTLKGASLEGLLDADGAAMVIHASADDQKTDPSGNSGDRIACGVFAAS